ncbi:MAG: hypothetical protein SVU32_09080, partial [Candidatus Nanohaloarchaea archaeon]|nr:hypothetical protein [Candidatus Nanohaloarchaea archaeon]
MDIHQLVSVVGTTALAVLLVLAGVTAVTGPAQAASDEPDIDIEVLAPDKVTEGDQVTIKIVVTAGQEVDVRVEVEGEPIGSATVDPSAAEEFEYTTTVEGTGTRDYNIDVHNDDTDEYLEGDTVSVEVQSKQQGWLGGIVSGFKNALQSVLFSPFTALAEALFGIITHVITSYPDLHPNAAVQEVHRIAMLAAVGISTLGVIVAGLLYQVGPILGYSYRQARLVLPRILVGLLFGAVAPFLLQYAVEFASALTIAFKPTHPDLARVWQLQSTIIIVTVIDATLLLMVAVLFVIRDVYLMFGAAIAPLLAVAWAIP